MFLKPIHALFVGLLACAIALAACDQQAEVTYQPQGWLAKDLPEIAAGLAEGAITSEALVKAYLARIERIDRAGPKLRSVISINPDALAQAKQLDDMKAAGQIMGPLHGVPILLKDNIESKDNLATTAGSLALKDNITGRDSPLVAGLRAQGALILGKTNLSQWANFRSDDSMSGWTSLGGQVKNPHVLDRNPCGSSSGSGAAMAASLAAATVGTETNGSVICPSNANGIVGFKPTVGLVSQAFIIPISSSQDTAGPMTKTVKGAAMLLDAMATGPAKTDYLTGLRADALKGKTVGVLRYAKGSNKDIQAKFEAALAVLKSQGAILVDIDSAPDRPDGFWPAARVVLDTEFKAGINAYLAEMPASVPSRTLEDLIQFNRDHSDVEMALFDQSIFLQAAQKGGLDDPDYIDARDKVQKATRADGIDTLLADYGVDLLVAPSGPVVPRIDPANGDVWPSFPGVGWMAAIAGYPHGTVPMGTIHGLSVGLSFMGGKDKDAEILAAMYAYEQATQLRAEPSYLPNLDERPEIGPALDGYRER